MSSRTTTEREYRPLRRPRTVLWCGLPRLPEKDQSGATLDPNTTEGYASNSAVGQSNPLLPKMSVAPGENSGAVDRWRVKWILVAVIEVGDRKTLIHHRGSIGWVMWDR